MLKKALWLIFSFLLGTVAFVALTMSAMWWVLTAILLWALVITSKPAKKIEIRVYSLGILAFVVGILIAIVTTSFWYNPLLDLIGG